MAFFQSAVGVLQTLVIALGAGLGIWGVVNLAKLNEYIEGQFSYYKAEVNHDLPQFAG